MHAERTTTSGLQSVEAISGVVSGIVPREDLDEYDVDPAVFDGDWTHLVVVDTRDPSMQALVDGYLECFETTPPEAVYPVLVDADGGVDVSERDPIDLLVTSHPDVENWWVEP